MSGPYSIQDSQEMKDLDNFLANYEAQNNADGPRDEEDGHAQDTHDPSVFENGHSEPEQHPDSNRVELGEDNPAENLEQLPEGDDGGDGDQGKTPNNAEEDLGNDEEHLATQEEHLATQEEHLATQEEHEASSHEHVEEDTNDSPQTMPEQENNQSQQYPEDDHHDSSPHLTHEEEFNEQLQDEIENHVEEDEKDQALEQELHQGRDQETYEEEVHDDGSGQGQGNEELHAEEVNEDGIPQDEEQQQGEDNPENEDLHEEMNDDCSDQDEEQQRGEDNRETEELHAEEVNQDGIPQDEEQQQGEDNPEETQEPEASEPSASPTPQPEEEKIQIHEQTEKVEDLFANMDKFLANYEQGDNTQTNEPETQENVSDNVQVHVQQFSLDDAHIQGDTEKAAVTFDPEIDTRPVRSREMPLSNETAEFEDEDDIPPRPRARSSRSRAQKEEPEEEQTQSPEEGLESMQAMLNNFAANSQMGVLSQIANEEPPNESQNEGQDETQIEENQTQHDTPIDQQNETEPEPETETEAGPPEGMEIVDAAPKFWQTQPVDSDISLSQLPPLGTSPELDAENKRLLRKFVKRGKIPYPGNRAQLIQYIQREKVNALVSQKFDEAQHYQTTLQKLQKAITDQELKDRNKQRLSSLDAKLGVAQSSLQSIQKETARLLKEEQARQRDREKELRRKQDEELDAFQEHWNDIDFLKKFAKPSARLLQLKNMERSMILTKMFTQVQEVKKKIKELEKEESDKAQARAVQEMDKERKKILARHALEQRTFEQHCARQLETIKQNQELKMQSIQKRQVKLESEIDEWKMNPPTALPPMASANPDLQHQAVMTPRTAQRYSVFKKVSKPPSITIKPLGRVKPRRKRPQTSAAVRSSPSSL